MLSSMIQYSSDYSRQDTTICREINNIESYLKLLKYRYEEDFSFVIRMAKDCEVVTIPKFILQPIVENAMKHSLNKVDFPWKIRTDCGNSKKASEDQ